MNFTTRTARRVLLSAALAAAAVGAPAIALAATSAPAATARPAVAACETPGLVIWLTSDGAGAGSSFYTLNFTNLSGHSCTLDGFPFVHTVNLKNAVIGRRAAFVHKPAPTTVTIKNGATATASLQVVDVLNFPKSACGPTTAAGFSVFPPNQQRAKIVPLPIGACTKMGENFMSVGRVH